MLKEVGKKAAQQFSLSLSLYNQVKNVKMWAATIKLCELILHKVKNKNVEF